MTRPKTPSSNRILPDCLLIGPQKAGNAWVDRYFGARDDVGTPRSAVETYFFDRHYHRGLDWYSSFFRSSRHKRRVIEVAPTYFHHPEAAGRILLDLGSIPLVCTLRNPARRVFSLYLHYRKYGLTRRPFRQALDQLPEILDSSRYATHLSRWIDVFGRDKLLVLFLEDLAADEAAYVSRLCRHLDVPFIAPRESLRQPFNVATLPYNAYLARFGLALGDAARAMRLYGARDMAKRVGLQKLFFGSPGSATLPEMSLADHEHVLSELAGEIDQVEKLLDMDLSHWKTIPATAAA